MNFNLPEIDNNISNNEYLHRDKYLKIYIRLIEKCLSMSKDELTGYNELHHILPKCLGGSSDPTNLVKMPFKYHIFAHLILTEIYPDKIDLINSLIIMISGGENVNEFRAKVIKKEISVRTLNIITNKAKLLRRGKNNVLSRKVLGPDGKIYESLHIASIENNIPYDTLCKWVSSAISTSCKNNHGWIYLDEQKIDYSDRKGGNNKFSKKVIGPNNIIYNSIVEACSKNNIPYTTLRYWLSGRVKDNHGWKFI